MSYNIPAVHLSVCFMLISPQKLQQQLQNTNIRNLLLEVKPTCRKTSVILVYDRLKSRLRSQLVDKKG